MTARAPAFPKALLRLVIGKYRYFGWSVAAKCWESLGWSFGGVGLDRGLREGGSRGWCEEGPGAARTILLLHIISATAGVCVCLPVVCQTEHSLIRAAQAIEYELLKRARPQ